MTRQEQVIKRLKDIRNARNKYQEVANDIVVMSWYNNYDSSFHSKYIEKVNKCDRIITELIKML